MVQVRDGSCDLGSVISCALSWPQNHERFGDTKAGVSVRDRSHLV